MIPGTSGEGEGAGPVNLKKFLRDHKLTDVESIFAEREIDVEELTEFEKVELVDFATDLGLDTLARKRFVNAIMALKKRMAAPRSMVTGASVSGSTLSTGARVGEVSKLRGTSSAPSALSSAVSHVMVSPMEQKAVARLQSANDKCDEVLRSIAGCERMLQISSREAVADIGDKWERILEAIEDKRQALLLEVESVRVEKETRLKEQLGAISEYMCTLNGAKTHFDEAMLSDPTALSQLSLATRSKEVVSKLSVAVQSSTVRLVIATQPRMALHCDTNALRTFKKQLELDDCDQPNAPLLSVGKVSFSSAVLSWRMPAVGGSDDIKKLIDFALELAPIKSVKKKSKKSKKKKKKRRKKRRRADDSSDSSDSDSDSSDSSDSDDSDEEEDDDRAAAIGKGKSVELEAGSDMMALSWKTQRTIKATKDKYWFDEDKGPAAGGWLFTVEKLKDSFQYGVRVRARNKSGWGLYSAPLKLTTKKMVIDSKILKSSKEKAALIKMLPKKMRKRRFKLLYRGSKDGYATTTFHQKCDAKGATLTVIRSNMNHVFGGYTAIPWAASGGQYLQDPKQQTFIYLLRTSQKHMKRKVPAKYTLKSTGVNAVYHCSSYGPTFGGGFDIYIAPNAGTTTSSYCNAGNSFNCATDQSLLAGSYNFMVKELEVYQLKK